MDLEYLKPGFDPNSLKVAQLRRILMENGVEFSPQSKKSTLVGLFEARVKPEIPKLRSRYDNLLPSDKGIVKVAVNSSKKVKKREKQKKKKGKISSAESAALSGSENHEADSNSGASAKSDRAVDLIASTAFSDVNEFQQGGAAKRKARKRKIVEKEGNEDREGLLDMGVGVEDQSHGGALDKKRRRKIGEGEHTPITEKVAQKSPNKSPHKSLTIDKFESSSSSESSFNESSILNVSRRGHAGTERSDDRDTIKNDFSFERKTLVPDLNSLNVSPAFADELKVAYKDNSVPVLARPESHSELEMNYISGPAEISVGKETSTEASTNVPHGDLTSTAKSESSDDNRECQLDTEKDVSHHGDINVEQPSMINTSQLPAEVDLVGTHDYIEQVTEKEHNLRTRAWPAKTFFKSLGRMLRDISLFLIIVMPIIYGLWYREQRILIGYCGHETETGKLFDSKITALSKIDEFLESQKPNCLPCPDHAICYPLMQMKCQPEYALHRNRWSLHHLLPLSDSCVKDTKREKLVSEVVKKSLEFLRMKNAQYSCGASNDYSKSGMTEKELYQIFYESRAPWINDDEFDELWSQAVSDLIKEPEITWRQVSNDFFSSSNSKIIITNNQEKWVQLPNSKPSAIDSTNDQLTIDGVPAKTGHFSETDRGKKTRILRSTSKKYVGLRCRFEREIYQTYNKYAYLIWSTVILVILVKYTSYRIRKFYKQREVIEELSKKVVSKLKAVKKQDQVPDFLSVVQLRDVLLADITDLSYKNKLWQAVAKTLERNNTNVRSTLMEIHGEIMKCWEWIGPLDSNTHDSQQ
ncbi:hypothetical protein HG536_0A05980 [Torulaspora globosa]|uniref:Man1/Src1 C-terminal domain-containing protein n=1 Tax=Torulaspora globosa TaxID=48254 RepID=A0A7G3ZB97_9SACH|nr:uncharacterized protein HG536_0A05980 [Torulaspora globosa]QLL30783.1 hypothetical protein HG536_0A05980 [Torulaspora globosa]